ncbi:MAG: formyltetrahydrofolate deformylase [Gemmatimonadota bacterium]|nr:MAG: formyltetrahydrofolate deformylase [Gemmatimonadota bacterium]
MSRKTATLLISCPDRTGIVAAVSEFVHRHGGNLVHSDQHTDRTAGLFLQRLEWEQERFALSAAEFPAAFQPLATRFEMTWELRAAEQPPRMAILVSKHGHCLYDLLARHRMAQLGAEIPLVVSNHPDLESATRDLGVDFLHLPVSPATKSQQEAALLERLQAERVDVIVLARYMQVLSAGFLSHWQHRVINIHHSFLPAFAGARPYHQAHERGVKIIGATAHYATQDLDEGPIIAQDVVRVSHRDSVRDLVAKGRDLEKIVLARAVSDHLADRVLVYGNKTVVFD